MHYFKVLKSITCVLLGLCTITTTAQSFPTTVKSSINIDATIGEIVKARSYTSEFVHIAKDNFKPDSNEYTHARELYASAFANYSAWDAYVASAIRNGNSKKVGSDPNYKMVTTSATDSANAFTDYVIMNTRQDKAVTTVISALATLGIEFWTKWSDKSKADRTAAATMFETETKWQDWDQIIGPSAKEPASPTPKTPTPRIK